jgi:hypothetical protein
MSTAEELDKIRRRAYDPGREPPAASPSMISFDMASERTVNIARCCDDPRPVLGDVVRNRRGVHVDLRCECGSTWAVARWR